MIKRYKSRQNATQADVTLPQVWFGSETPLAGLEVAQPIEEWMDSEKGTLSLRCCSSC